MNWFILIGIVIIGSLVFRLLDTMAVLIVAALVNGFSGRHSLARGINFWGKLLSRIVWSPSS